MQTISYTSAGGNLSSRRQWTEEMANRFGLDCRLDTTRAGHSIFTQWRAGPLKLTDAELAWLRLSPVMQRTPVWLGEYMLLKQVESGSMTIEQNGNTHRIDAGGIVLVDPARAFHDQYREPTRIISLRIPKQSLRDRGIRYTLNDLYFPDLKSPDVAAVRDYVSFTARHAYAISTKLLDRLGDQCLECFDIVIGDAPSQTQARSAAALALRARQVIARSIGNPDLTVAKIAEELNVSANYLSRVFRSEGRSPMRYVWSVRLSHAARLLAETPVDRVMSKEIAFRCGFSNASNFSRAFKEEYGVAPLTYARRAHDATGKAGESESENESKGENDPDAPASCT
ncbi:AraC family transcriptional regulator [Paraburkholderia humisilvae]|uniref:AraC family transcriptional regulator n=1 Tax=Paraburkholderia humisilvae TaxID=627669 RepID=UPI00361F5C28